MSGLRVKDVLSGGHRSWNVSLLCLNPQTRPIDISEHWSTVLLQEWAKQASLEQELSLPVSVVASADAALQAKGQIGFIDLFTLPLFEAAAFAMPGELDG